MTGLGQAMPVVAQTVTGRSSMACSKTASSQPATCELDPEQDLICHNRHLHLNS